MSPSLILTAPVIPALPVSPSILSALFSSSSLLMLCCFSTPPPPPPLHTHTPHTIHRSVGFTGSASEAVHYALVYLDSLLEVDKQFRRNGQVSCTLVIKPQLELPDVFEMLHHSNQVTPLLVLEAVVGKRGICVCACVHLLYTEAQFQSVIIRTCPPRSSFCSSS